MTRPYVYGTLRRGCRAHYFLEPVAQEVVTAETAGELYALPEGYPAFLFGDGVVVGELVTVAEAHAQSLLSRLDRFEGYFGRGLSANLFIRDTLSVTVSATGVDYDAEVYVYADDDRARALGSHIADGDWLGRGEHDARPR